MSWNKADKNLPVIKYKKKQLLDKQKLSKSCLYILSLNVVLKNNSLENVSFKSFSLRFQTRARSVNRSQRTCGGQQHDT